MKNWLPLIFIFFSISIYSQNSDSLSSTPILKSKETRFEFMIVPLLLYNRIDIGIGRKANKIEHTILTSSYLLSIIPAFNLQLSYNLNLYLKNNKSYIPLWGRISNTRKNFIAEEGYVPHTLRYSIGSGFGKIFKISKKLFLRTEFGIGLSLNLTNSDGKLFPFKTNFNDYKIDQHNPKQNPPLLPSFRFKLNFIYSKKVE
jgi:hypothetical protein